MKNKIQDCIIIGMGPAGITAAIYLSRLNIKPLCIEEKSLASKLSSIPLIQNYPGFVGKGSDLAQLFTKQVEDNNILIYKSRVSTIQKDEDNFRVQCEDGIFYSKSVLVTAGIRPNPLIIPGGNKYSFRGISRCAVCDGPLYRNKDIAVYGDKSTAIQESLYLADICHMLYFICPEKSISAPSELVKELESKENVKIIYEGTIVGSIGSRSIEEIQVKCKDETMNFSVRGLFLYTGEANNATFLPFPEVFDNRNFIIVDENKSTPISGLFAAGDVTITPLRQIVTACGDGAIAAFSIKQYLKTRRL